MAKMKKSEGEVVVSKAEEEVIINSDNETKNTKTSKTKKTEVISEVIVNNDETIHENETKPKKIDKKSKASKVNETEVAEQAVIASVEEKEVEIVTPKTKSKVKISKNIVENTDDLKMENLDALSMENDTSEADKVKKPAKAKKSKIVPEDIKSEIEADLLKDLNKEDLIAGDVVIDSDLGHPIAEIEILDDDIIEGESPIEAKRRKRRSKKAANGEFEPFDEPIKIEGKAFKLRKGEDLLQVPSKKEHVEVEEIVPPAPLPTAKQPTAKPHTTRRGKKDDHHRKENKYLAQAEEIKASIRNQEPRLEAYKPEVKKVEIVPKVPAPDMRYSDEDLQMFFEVISTAKFESMEELRMLRERLEDLTSSDHAEESMIYSMHMAEQGSEAMEKEKTYAQVQRISEYIKKLDDALERIKMKTYGICRICGCLIAKERLLAVPITTLSAAYKIHEKCPEDNIDKIEPLKSKVSV